MSHITSRKNLLPALRTSSASRLMKAPPSSSSSPSALRVALPPLSPTPRMAWTQEVRGPQQLMDSLRPTVEEDSVDDISSLCEMDLFSRQKDTTATTTTTWKGNQVDEMTSPQKISRALIGRARNSFPDIPTRQLNCRQWYSEYDDKFRVPGGPFPPRVPRGSAVHPAPYTAGVRYYVPQGKTLQTEYQACFTGRAGMLARQKDQQLMPKKHQQLIPKRHAM